MDKMTRIEFRQFRYFIAVAEELHFGHAADRMGIAQPGLSQQIKALERSLGVELLVRDRGKRVALTEAGRAFLPPARLMIEMANRAVETARLAATGKKGALKVGTGVSGTPPVADELLREFQVRFPDVLVEIHPGLGPQNVDALTRRRLDVAVLLAPFATPDSARTLNYLALGQVELLVALPEGHRLASFDRIPRSQLLREPFLDWPRHSNPVLIDHLHRLLFGDAGHPLPRTFLDLTEGNRVLQVAQGREVTAILNPWVTELGVRGVVFRRLEDPAPLVEYGIAWFDSGPSPFLAEFISLAHTLAKTPVTVESAPIDRNA
jgi:DNA-binding transcriptional LysR family regulator